MSGFGELGLRIEVVDAAASAGFDAPSAIQRAAVPVLRRGANVVLVGASGSGATTAWVLALLDRLAQASPPALTDQATPGSSGLPAHPPATGDASNAGVTRPRALVITGTEDRATAIAQRLKQLQGALRISVRAQTVAWSGRGGDDVLVAPLGAAARAVRESALKLDTLQTVVFDGVAVLQAIEPAAVFDAMAVALPADAQRVVVAAEWTRELEHFIEGHARRAMTVPARLADPSQVVAPSPAGAVSYLVVGESEKPAALARVLRRPRATPPLVTTRSSRRATELAGQMRARGFIMATAAGEPGDAVVLSAAHAKQRALIAYDVPFDADALQELDLTNGLVLVEPLEELAHLRGIARSPA